MGYAAHFGEPWFAPLWEFQGRVGFYYDHEKRVQSPKGSFNELSNDYTAQFALAVTPWPYWNVRTDLFLTRATDIDFSYQVSFWGVRYLWLDDVEGDLFSLTTGVALFFPGNRYLRDFSFAYHGNANVEFHAAIGKEWARCDEWVTRIWALGGWGIANRGKPSISGRGGWEFNLSNDFECGIFSELLYGLGDNDIIPDVPFKGYGLINHQNVDIGGYLGYQIGYLGRLSVVGWYNVYAHNFVEHYFGIGATILVPFSL